MFKGKIKFNFNIKKRILPVILVSALMPLILFVAIPFEVFANNMDEFLFSLSSFFPHCLLFGFLLAEATILLLLFLPEKLYRVAYALVLAFSLLFFMQGTFLNFGMNSLGGDKLGDNTVHIGLKILDAIIWIVVLCAAVALALIKDKKGIFAIIAVILSIVVAATQIMTPVTSTVKHPDVFTSKEERLASDDGGSENKVVTSENLTSLSTERNIFYFCIDKFDEYFAEVAYEQKPEIFEELEGFTWFKDNVALYGHTFPAVAYMLTEHEYDTAQFRKPYLETVYNDNNTLSVLHDNGYSINLFTQPHYAYETADTLPDYVENISILKDFTTAYTAKLVDRMLMTSTYRCLPLFFKDWIYGVDSAAYNACVSTVGENGYDGYALYNDVVYNQVADTAFTQRGGKNFSFVHIDGCHSLAVDYISKPATAKQKNEITSVVEDSFKIVNEYIKALKEKGLYENATIIITGDHAVTVQARYEPKGAKLTALFFKRSGDGGTPLAASDAPVSQENLWPTVMQSENIQRENNGVTLFEVTGNNERKHVFHTFNSNKCDVYIYRITGSGKSFDNWELVEHNHLNHSYMD